MRSKKKRNAELNLRQNDDSDQICNNCLYFAAGVCENKAAQYFRLPCGDAWTCVDHAIRPSLKTEMDSENFFEIVERERRLVGAPCSSFEESVEFLRELDAKGLVKTAGPIGDVTIRAYWTNSDGDIGGCVSIPKYDLDYPL